MTAQPKEQYTPKEYLEIERAAENKNEYFDGEIFAMTGASRKHNLISLNTASELRYQLKKKNCEVYTNDMRVQVQPTGLYTYPDVVIACGPPEFEDDHIDTLLNPAVIIEVLSKSTESYDRGRKFEHYRSLNTIAEYLMIHQETPHVEHFIRQPDNSWLFFEYKGLDKAFEIKTVHSTLEMGEIYEKVLQDGSARE